MMICRTVAEATVRLRVRRLVEGEVVVPPDHELMLVRQRRDPGVEGAHLLFGPVEREVAGVHQHVAVRHLEACVVVVRVGDRDEANHARG